MFILNHNIHTPQQFNNTITWLQICQVSCITGHISITMRGDFAIKYNHNKYVFLHVPKTRAKAHTIKTEINNPWIT